MQSVIILCLDLCIQDVPARVPGRTIGHQDQQVRGRSSPLLGTTLHQYRNGVAKSTVMIMGKISIIQGGVEQCSTAAPNMYYGVSIL